MAVHIQDFGVVPVFDDFADEITGGYSVFFVRKDTCKMCWLLMICLVRLASYSLFHAGAGLDNDPAIVSVSSTEENI